MEMETMLALLLVLFCGVLLGNSQMLMPCTTPNHELGICVNIKSCQVIMKGLLSGKRDNFDFIRESRCDQESESSQPRICCGRYTDYKHKDTETSTAPTPATTKPSVSTPQHQFPKFCRTTTNLQRIIGGTTATSAEFPWLARLRHMREDGLLTYACTGFLISEKFVITAAHCVASKKMKELGPIYQVLLGEELQPNKDCDRMGKACIDFTQLLRTADTVVHPQYSNDFQYYHDIAVIPLVEPAKFTNFVRPICLPFVETDLSKVTQYVVAGWGQTETAAESKRLLKVSIPKTDKAHCDNLYRKIGVTLLDSQICAGGESGRDSCAGDSGGPLMVQRPQNGWVAEGVISFGKGCGEAGWPGVYTSVSHHLPWIQNTIDSYLKNETNKKEI